MKELACRKKIPQRVRTMKEKLWLLLVPCLAYCIDKELCKVIV